MESKGPPSLGELNPLVKIIRANTETGSQNSSNASSRRKGKVMVFKKMPTKSRKETK